MTSLQAIPPLFDPAVQDRIMRIKSMGLTGQNAVVELNRLQLINDLEAKTLDEASRQRLLFAGMPFPNRLSSANLNYNLMTAAQGPSGSASSAPQFGAALQNTMQKSFASPQFPALPRPAAPPTQLMLPWR